MNEILKEFQKYRWFLTSARNVVVGGKRAAQNDSLLHKIKLLEGGYYVMHTSEPGSPFSVILEEMNKVSKEELREAAVFTACFSRAWKLKKSKTRVDIFSSLSLFKTREMKEGTWAVKERIKTLDVPLILVLTKQKGIIRAVPEPSVKKKKEIILRIEPGSMEKEDIAAKLATEMRENLNQEELLSALPTGGIKIVRSRK